MPAPPRHGLSREGFCRPQEDTAAPKGGASKRKLKKDRRAKRQELADEAQSCEVTWDEDQARP